MVVEKLEHSQIKVTFDVTVEEFEKALDAAFEKANAKANIKGFRAGKAPRSVYEKTYGIESLYDEALNDILNDKVEEIYKDQELARTIVGRFMPVFDEKVVRGNPFKVSLVVDVYPEVELPEYKGIEVKAKKLNATRTEVDNAIKALTKKDAQMVTKEEQVIAKGDYATFDFVGSVDGVEFPGGSAENYELQIGSGQFIPGFEDQMIGMKAEETKDLNVKFPKNYGEASLAGKDAVFKVTVHEVKEEKFPEMTDEYVQSLKVEGASNLKELKAVKKAEIEARKAVSEKDRQFDEIVNKILDGAKVDMPQSLIDERVEQFKGQYEQQAKMYNIPFETFLSLMNITKEQFDEEALKQASRQALFNVVASKIIEDEKLMPSKEAIEARAKEDADKTGKSVDEMLQANLSRYYSDLSYNALSEFLLSNAQEV